MGNPENFPACGRLSLKRSFLRSKIGETVFLRPVNEKDLINFYVSEPVIGTTSIRFDLTVKLMDGTPVLKSTEFLFVAVDEHGKKKPIQRPNKRKKSYDGVDRRSIIVS